MFNITKGYYAGNDAMALLKSLGMVPKDVAKAKAVLEMCSNTNDLANYADELKAACSDFQFTAKDESALVLENPDLLVTDFLLQVYTGKAYDRETGKATWKPLASSIGQKAVNTSSSIQVSSEAYETTISNQIMNEVFKRTYVRDLIPNKIVMPSKAITLPTLDQMVDVEWIASAAFGTTNSTGTKWAHLAIKERTYTTFKCAAKGFLSDEVEEDSIIALMPLLREALITGISNSINQSFLSGDGAGKPLGLLKQAKKVAINVTGKSLLSTVLKGIQGKDILRAKHSIPPMARKGSKVVLIASQTALGDLEGDEAFQDVSQVGEARASKLIGWKGNFYNIPVIEGWNDDFGWADDAAPVIGEPVAILVAVDNFAVFEQRSITTEFERDAESQRDNFYVTSRVNMSQMKNLKYSAVCLINQA